jgi:hypothetical protein
VLDESAGVYPADDGNMFLRNLGDDLMDYVPSHMRSNFIIKKILSYARFEVFTAVSMNNVVFSVALSPQANHKIQKSSSYLKGDTLLLRYRTQPC